jgi:copper chaperone CopZ
LKKTKGVRDAIINLEQNRATVIFTPSETSIKEIKQSIIDVGFQVGSVKEVQ